MREVQKKGRRREDLVLSALAPSQKGNVTAFDKPLMLGKGCQPRLAGAVLKKQVWALANLS